MLPSSGQKLQGSFYHQPAGFITFYYNYNEVWHEQVHTNSAMISAQLIHHVKSILISLLSFKYKLKKRSTLYVIINVALKSYSFKFLIWSLQYDNFKYFHNEYQHVPAVVIKKNLKKNLKCWFNDQTSYLELLKRISLFETWNSKIFTRALCNIVVCYQFICTKWFWF